MTSGRRDEPFKEPVWDTTLHAHVVPMVGSNPADDSLATTLPSKGAVKQYPISQGSEVGNYTVEKLIGEGGFGHVWRVLHRELGQRRAMKVVVASVATQTSFERFKQEMKLLARIRHPNVVEVYDSGALPDGSPYYVMELLNGNNLQDEIARKYRGKAPPWSATREIVLQICDGLEAIHRRGIVHRDMKPENCMAKVDLDDDAGEVCWKIVDLGVAKRLSGEGRPNRTIEPGTAVPRTGRTADGSFLGTLDYASPEQLLGDPTAVGFHSDLYSLGVILYELLTGAVPHPATVAEASEIDGPRRRLARITAEPPPPPSTRVPNPTFPRELDDILARALRLDPRQRFSSIGDLSAAIRNLPVSGPLTVRRHDSRPHATPVPRRADRDDPDALAEVRRADSRPHAAASRADSRPHAEARRADSRPHAEARRRDDSRPHAEARRDDSRPHAEARRDTSRPHATRVDAEGSTRQAETSDLRTSAEPAADDVRGRRDDAAPPAPPADDRAARPVLDDDDDPARVSGARPRERATGPRIVVAVPRRSSRAPLVALVLVAVAVGLLAIPAVRERLLPPDRAASGTRSDPPAPPPIAEDLALARTAIRNVGLKETNKAQTALQKLLDDPRRSTAEVAEARALLAELLLVRALACQIAVALDPSAMRGEATARGAEDPPAAREILDLLGDVPGKPRLLALAALVAQPPRPAAQVPAGDDELATLVRAAPLWQAPPAAPQVGLVADLQRYTGPSTLGQSVLALALARNGDLHGARDLVLDILGQAADQPAARTLLDVLDRQGLMTEQGDPAAPAPADKPPGAPPRPHRTGARPSADETAQERIETMISTGCQRVRNGHAADGVKLLLETIDLGARPSENFNLCFCLANGLARQNDHASALGWYVRAVNQSPRNRDAVAGAARSAELLLRIPVAVEYYRKLLELAPDNTAAQAYLRQHDHNPTSPDGALMPVRRTP